MVKINNLSKTYISEPVFSGVSFVLAKDEIIGLVGENGAGKSTLMKILAQEIDEYIGDVVLQSEIVGYMPQEADFSKYKLVGEFIEAEVSIWENYKFDIALSTLGFEYYDEYQEIATLSGGEKTKLYIASLMVKDPTLLLLDEPTNHLDVDSIIALQEFLSNFKGKVLVISHDRVFLDSITSRIFELKDKKLHQYVGNYSSYSIQKEKENEIQLKEHVNWLKKKKQIEELIENVRKIGGGKSRGRAVGAAKKRYEREVVKREVKDPFADTKISKISLAGSSHKGKMILQVENLSHKFGKKEVLKDVTFEIRGNDRTWLYGRNGSGKTTILKAVKNLHFSDAIDPNLSINGPYGELQKAAGSSTKLYRDSIRLGNDLNIGYYSQDQDFVNFSNSLEDEMQRLGKVDWQKTISILQRLQFTKHDWPKRVNMLSFGQRARLIFGAFSLGNYNFLILDEPTNHLDIPTREIIEDALIGYKGSMLIVSHDRYFVQKLDINKILFLERGVISKSESF